MLNVGGYNPLSFIDSDGISFVIYFQGCSRKCKNCHNPELQSFEGGTPTKISDIIDKIVKNKNCYDSVVLQGGEPLEQDINSLISLIQKIKELNLKVWLYTGYTYPEVPESLKSICDVFVTGAYVDELKTGGFPASLNQEVIYTKI